MKYYKDLTAAIISEDFYLTDEIISKIKTEDDSIEYVTMILTFMENNPALEILSSRYFFEISLSKGLFSGSFSL